MVKKIKVTKYKGVLREYTLLGISKIFKTIVSKNFNDFFGGESPEDIIVVIRNGDFYHFQVEEDIKRLGQSFLKRIVNENIDFEKLYVEFDNNIIELEKIYNFKEEELSLKIIEKFFNIYSYLIKFVYASAYSIDVIEILSKNNQIRCKIWIEKCRLRGEKIYKFGEMEFIPIITDWLSKEKFYDYDSESLQYLFFDELISYIKNGKDIPPKNILEQRKELVYAIFYPFEKSKIFIGQEASKIITEKKLFSEIDEKIDDVKEFKGRIGFKGFIKGLVRIIKKRADMPNFRDNEIIVSPMTDPSYLPIMKRAVAFVTDEGGILCHAAIVAREMKKPCIIGTKIATKVLRDGDLVEVDAEKGVVKILKRAKN